MREFSFQFAWVRLGIAASVALGAWQTSAAVGPCAKTPAEAVRAFAGEPVDAAPDGYRVMRTNRDAVLGTRMALIERCGHPEWPQMTLSLGRFGGEGDAVPAARAATAERLIAVQNTPKVVRSGETVRLWAQDANVRLEVAAVSEEAGGVGDRVRLRVTTQQEFGESVRYLYGLVRGPADVEMVQ